MDTNCSFIASLYGDGCMYFSITEAVDDVTRHVGIVALNVPSILRVREFDLSENDAAASKLDAASPATSSMRSLPVYRVKMAYTTAPF